MEEKAPYVEFAPFGRNIDNSVIQLFLLYFISFCPNLCWAWFSLQRRTEENFLLVSRVMLRHLNYCSGSFFQISSEKFWILKILMGWVYRKNRCLPIWDRCSVLLQGIHKWIWMCLFKCTVCEGNKRIWASPHKVIGLEHLPNQILYIWG